MIDYEILAIADGCAGQLVEAREALLEKIKVTSASDIKAAENDDEEGSYLLQMQDNVGVIQIKGALTGRDSFWNKYFGIVSYNEIVRASAEAVAAGAGSILYMYSSPGGEVHGMSQAASFISHLPIPTVTFAAGQMASAGYFLGAQSDHVYAEEFADVGSVGVLLKLYDITAMNAKAGIKVERFRSGDLKAVGDPNFKLTDKERDYITNQINVYAQKFYKVVSEARGMPLATLESLGITSGRTFIGEEAKAANLVDKIVTFEQAMLKAYDLATKYIDKKSKSNVNWMRN